MQTHTAERETMNSGIDPARVPQRTLQTGARMPAIGLGTFGSDHVPAGRCRRGCEGAAQVGYRHFDCASVYGNEAEIGARLTEVWPGAAARRVVDHLQAVERQACAADVIASCGKSLADLRLDYLDMYLVHWPFPNFHPPGCDVTSRSPDARPYIHANFMRTWRQMEELVDRGLGAAHRHVEHDHSQAEAAAARCADQAGGERDGTASAFPAAGAVRICACQRH